MSVIWGELEQKARATLKDAAYNIVDWRPASDVYIEDLVKIDGGKAVIPFGILYELENGDIIICIPRHEEPEIHRSEEKCEDCVYYNLYAHTYPGYICKVICGDK